MDDVVVQPRTAPWADKRLYLAVGTVLALLISNFTGHEVDPTTMAGIITVVVGFIGASATKEAAVAKAVVAGQAAASRVDTLEKAVSALAARPPP